MHPTLAQRALAAVGTIAIATIGTVAPAAADGNAPAGNNGTIKIDDVAMDDGNENVPHPGCTFVVDFFGYDVGVRQATLDFVGQAPTGGGNLLHDSFPFEVTSRESGNQLNASRTVDLSDALADVEPHPKQGWHVKLTVHVDGAQGSDVKHKVFWVSDCDEDAAAAPAAGAGDEDEVVEDVDEVVDAPAAEAEGDDDESGDESDDVAAVEAANVAAWMRALEANGASASPAPASAVLAAEATAPAGAAAASAPGATLPMTGSATDAFLPLGVGLIASGVALVLAARRQPKQRTKHAS